MASTYPWAHLLSTVVDGEEDDNDYMVDVTDVKQELNTANHELNKRNGQFQELKTISAQTFDDMKKTIADLKTRVAEADVTISQLKQASGFFDDLVLTQVVIAHSRNMDRKQGFKKVKVALYNWFKQRSKVLEYLQKKNIEQHVLDDKILKLSADYVKERIETMMEIVYDQESSASLLISDGSEDDDAEEEE